MQVDARGGIGLHLAPRRPTHDIGFAFVERSITALVNVGSVGIRHPLEPPGGRSGLGLGGVTFRGIRKL
jgi:hypothetical protein